MIKYIIRGIVLVGCGVLSFLLWTAFHIPNTQDVDIANALAHSVGAAYGQFLPRPEVDQTSRGKVLYTHPGASGNPTFVIYEVTEAADRSRIVNAARSGLATAQAHSVTIQFYERQNVTHYDGGGIRRGPEHLIETVKVTRGE